MLTFRDRVLGIVKKIPRGSVLAYGDVAKKAGYPRAARAVGSVLKTNFDPDIPCHRVVRSDGSLGEYNRGVMKKRALLIAEGVALEDASRDCARVHRNALPRRAGNVAIGLLIIAAIAIAAIYGITAWFKREPTSDIIFARGQNALADATSFTFEGSISSLIRPQTGTGVIPTGWILAETGSTSIELSFDGATNLASVPPSFDSNVTFNARSATSTLRGSADIRSVDGKMYFRFTDPPVVSIINLAPLKNIWIEGMAQNDVPKKSSLTSAMVKNIRDAMRSASFCSVTGEPANDTVNGRRAVIFTGTVDRQGIADFAMKVHDITGTKINKTELDAWVRQSVAASEPCEIAIDAETFEPISVSITMSAGSLQGQDRNASLSVKFQDFGSAQSISAPPNPKSSQEVFTDLFSGFSSSDVDDQDAMSGAVVP